MIGARGTHRSAMRFARYVAECFAPLALTRRIAAGSIRGLRLWRAPDARVAGP